METATPARVDPISEKYASLRKGENIGDALFYAAALVSIIIVFVDHSKFPKLYDLMQGLFVTVVALLFVLGLAVRLNLKPAAEDARRLDLISNSTQVPLLPERSVGYYNNEQADPIRRLGLNTLENSLFSEAIASEMLPVERVKVAVYAVLFLGCLLYRQADLGVVAAGAQAVLSEQIVSKWIRLEWLRSRCARVYDELFALFQSGATTPVVSARVLDAFTLYETSKANAALALSSKIFEKRNAELSKKWEQIKETLGVR
jgi:hypothetical protein